MGNKAKKQKYNPDNCPMSCSDYFLNNLFYTTEMNLWKSEDSAVRNNSLEAEEMAHCLLLFQRARVQLPVPKSFGAQMPVAPAPGNLSPSSGACTCEHTHTDLHTK